MIQAEHSLTVDASIDGVWNYVKDIRRWAILFPGCKECDVIDEHDSKWTIKVGAGGLIKTVNVLVHVDQWDGPGRVNFSYKLEAEPVVGTGSYIATPVSAGQTEITLQLQVNGSGSMAPMWEAVGRPLLPQLAKMFSTKLKSEIEATAGEFEAQSVPPPVQDARPGSFLQWLRSVWRAIFKSHA